MQKESLKACRIDEEELLAIRQAKLKELQGALDDLQIIGMATGLYEKTSTDIDYKTFENHTKETFEFSSGDTKFTSEKIDSVLGETSDEEYVYVVIKHFGKDKKEKIFDMLLSPGYTPPHDWREIADHLTMLQLYYFSDFDYYHQVMELYLDLSLCKILRAIGSLSVIRRLDGNELARVKNLRNGVRKKVEEKSTPVSEIFFTDVIKDGMKMNAVANVIREDFIERQKRNKIDDKITPPSLAAIKDYLKKDKDIMKYFKKKGKFWIVET